MKHKNSAAVARSVSACVLLAISAYEPLTWGQGNTEELPTKGVGEFSAATTADGGYMGNSVSFKIHNNLDAKVTALDIYDSADKNNPSKLQTIANVEAGSTTGAISAPILAPGSSSARVSWSWDGNEVNFIAVEDGDTYQMSSGAPSP